MLKNRNEKPTKVLWLLVRQRCCDGAGSNGISEGEEKEEQVCNLANRLHVIIIVIIFLLLLLLFTRVCHCFSSFASLHGAFRFYGFYFLLLCSFRLFLDSFSFLCLTQAVKEVVHSFWATNLCRGRLLFI